MTINIIAISSSRVICSPKTHLPVIVITSIVPAAKTGNAAAAGIESRASIKKNDENRFGIPKANPRKKSDFLRSRFLISNEITLKQKAVKKVTPKNTGL